MAVIASNWGAPISYLSENAYMSMIHPSTVHVNHTPISNFFKRYLLQKAISVFDWTMPDNWTEPYYPLYCLYMFGKVCILNTDSFGPVPQQCSLEGYGLYYQPTHAVVMNPLLQGSRRLRIGTQCVVLQLEPDYGGIYDLIEVFGDLMSLCLEASSVNLLNSRLAYVASASNKAQAESYKKVIDDIISGKPGVVVNKNILPKDTAVKDMFQIFNNQVGSNFITPEIINVWQTLENMFDTEIGIPAANTEKRERMISAEIKVGSVETYSRAEMWLNLLQKRIDEAKALFGPSLEKLSVDWRYPPELTGMGGEENAVAGVNNNSYNVQR